MGTPSGCSLFCFKLFGEYICSLIINKLTLKKTIK